HPAGLVKGTAARGAHRQARVLPVSPFHFLPVEPYAGLELLEHQVARLLHSERAVGRLRAAVLALDVQPETAHPGVARGKLLDVAIEALVDAFAPPLRPHVDALDPPEFAVLPIAPFLGEEKRADDAAAFIRNDVEARGRVAE